MTVQPSTLFARRLRYAALVGCVLGAPAVMASGATRMTSHEVAVPGELKDSQGPKTSTVPYAVPDVMLIRDDGKRVSLREEMNDGRPVVLNFIFTSCGSICPLMSQVFGGFQQRLGEGAKQVHLMSISIDPEHDTPERLVEYARKFDARPGWQHYTGTLEASLAAQRAFDVYRGDRMSHTPVTLLRAAPGEPWRRIDGFATPDDLLREYRQLRSSR